MPRTCSRGHHDRPINGVCPAWLLIAEGNADQLETLKAEVLIYLEGYTSRGVHSEGLALERLRKAAEQDHPVPSPGSPGTPERIAEQREKNERTTRMAGKVAKIKPQTAEGERS